MRCSLRPPPGAAAVDAARALPSPRPDRARAAGCAASGRRRSPLAVGLAVCLPLWAMAAPPSFEQDPGPGTSPPRLLEQVVLDYPSEVEPGLHGDVTIRVTVDPGGDVTAVEVLEGPEVFHEVAAAAGARLRFAPALRDGQAVASTAVIFFHFAPPDASLGDPGDPAVEIVVHGDPDLEDTHARSTLGAEAIDRAAGTDLAETVAQVPGVTLARGTADATKPMIRGQPERRLLVLYDGVRHESQKWGPDHATEIDPFSAGEISVIRGAAGARYGPDAIGGVILVQPPPLRAEPGVGGKALTAYASNGRRGYGALRLDVAPEAVPGLAIRAEGNYARGASLSAPDYVLGNTGSEQWNGGASIGYRRGDSGLRATWHHYDLRAGVFYGVRNTTPTEFQAQLQADRPVTADLWSTTPEIDRPYQDVRHDVMTLHADTALGAWGVIEAIYAFQLNQRQEFEQVRGSVTGPQYDFTLRTHSVDAVARPHAVRVGEAWLKGGAGIQGTFQENVYQGLPLLPNFRGFGGGAFAWQRLSFRRFDVEVGARFDQLSRTAWFGDQDYEGHLRRGTLDATRCDEGAGVARCPAGWRTGSASLGVLAHPVPEHLDLKLDLSTASRFPNADEMYLVGNAPSFPVFALGFPDLGVETTWGASTTAVVRLPWLDGELSGFANLVDQYVYFAPDIAPGGGIGFEVNIRGTWPRYAYQPIDAVFYGGDGGFRLGPEAAVGLDVQGAVVRARALGSGDPLIGIPADHARVALVGRPTGSRVFRAPEVAVFADLVARQSRVDLDADFAPPPDGYLLLGLSANVELHLRRQALHLGLDATNLTDASYREYTSLLRYYADQPGRDVRARVGFDF